MCVDWCYFTFWLLKFHKDRKPVTKVERERDLVTTQRRRSDSQQDP